MQFGVFSFCSSDDVPRSNDVTEEPAVHGIKDADVGVDENVAADNGAPQQLTEHEGTAADPVQRKQQKRRQRYGDIADYIDEREDESDDDEAELNAHSQSARTAAMRGAQLPSQQPDEEDGEVGSVAADSEHWEEESEDLRHVASRKRRKGTDTADAYGEASAYGAIRTAGRDFARGDAPTLPMRLALQELETLSGMTTRMQEMVNRSKKHFELKVKCAIGTASFLFCFACFEVLSKGAIRRV